MKQSTQITSVIFMAVIAVCTLSFWLNSQGMTEKGNFKPSQEASTLLGTIEKAVQLGLDDTKIDQQFFAFYCSKRRIVGTFQERLDQITTQAYEWRRENTERRESHIDQEPKQSNTELLPLPETAYQGYPEITVTSTADDGPGSLRDAVRQAEAVGGSRRIVFRLTQDNPNFDSTKGTWQITLKSVIYIFTNRIFIDGFSQTVFGGNTNPKGPEIVIIDESGLILDVIDSSVVF